jgi:hypothetical protein
VVDLAHISRVREQLSGHRADTSSPRTGGTLVIVGFIAFAVILVLGVSLTVISRFSPEGIRFLLSQPPPATVNSGPPKVDVTAVAPPPRSVRASPTIEIGAPTPITSTTGHRLPAAPPSSRVDALPGAPAPSPADGMTATQVEPTPSLSSSISPSVSVSGSPSTTSSNTPSVTPSGTSSDAPTPTPTASTSSPAPSQDELPINAPGGSVLVDAVWLSTDPAAPRSVTLQGLRPGARYASLNYTFVDWGDSSGQLVASPDPADPADLAGLSLTHSYVADGTYTISWGYSADVEHRWTHTVTIGATTGATPPEQSLSVADSTDNTVTFAVADPNTEPWSQWTLDYGDGTYAWGADASTPAASDLVHAYDGSGHTAVLTVIAPDGELTTSRVSTP